MSLLSTLRWSRLATNVAEQELGQVLRERGLYEVDGDWRRRQVVVDGLGMEVASHIELTDDPARHSVGVLVRPLGWRRMFCNSVFREWLISADAG